jgi:hypothetical protein
MVADVLRCPLPEQFHPILIPSAKPAHSPSVNAISQLGRLPQTQEASLHLKLLWLPSCRHLGFGWQRARGARDVQRPTLFPDVHDNLRSVFGRGRRSTAAWKCNDSLSHAMDTTSTLAGGVADGTDIFPHQVNGRSPVVITERRRTRAFFEFAPFDQRVPGGLETDHGDMLLARETAGERC